MLSRQLETFLKPCLEDTATVCNLHMEIADHVASLLEFVFGSETKALLLLALILVSSTNDMGPKVTSVVPLVEVVCLPQIWRHLEDLLLVLWIYCHHNLLPFVDCLFVDAQACVWLRRREEREDRFLQ